MDVKIYIGDRVLDLFQDEGMQLTSKLSDIEKLSNVFTDFSDSLTVPGTANNNEIFKHYYDVDIDNTFNANIRVPAYIEIKSIPFRTGKIQLEGIKLKQYNPDSYKITFYGGLTQLPDLFLDDTINLLDYEKDITGSLVKTWDSLSKYDYEYTSANFINSINLPSFKSGSVITPLIAYTNRDWNYGSANSIDISGSAGAILDSELRPAIRILPIIEGIEAKYGINFSRNFFGSATFNNLYMWMNAQQEAILGQKTLMQFYNPLTGSIDAGNITELDNVFSVNRQQYSQIAAVEFIARLDFTITPSNLTTEYNMYLVDENGFEVKKWENLQGVSNISKEWVSEYKMNGNESLRVIELVSLLAEPEQTITFNIDVNATYKRKAASVTTVYTDISSNTNSTLVTVAMLVEKNLPKMKVIDFIQGIMKMFKLVIRPITVTSFYVNTLNGYYSDGSTLDITEYVDEKEVEIQRPLIYKNIQFNFQKTNNFLGKKYRELTDPTDTIGYGDLKASYPEVETKEELKVELPFENMLFERMTVQQPNPLAGADTNLVIGQSISSADNGTTFSKNNSKPILFFNNGMANNGQYPIKVNFKGTVASVAYNYLIGNTNDEFLDQVTDTVNWGAEVDPWHQSTVANSLYLNYWENWINTIYDLKQRKFTFQANLPVRYVEELSLNDVLIIGNTRYRLNDYKIALDTGKTTLTLFKDIFLWNKYTFPVTEEFTSYAFSPTGSSLYFTDNLGDDSFYLYGSFTSYSGSAANRIIKIQPNGEIDRTFNYGTGFNSNPFSYSELNRASGSDSIIATGYFTTYSGSTANRIAMIKPNGNLDTSFNSGTGFSTGTNGAAVDSSGSIYVTGNFTTYSGSSQPRIAKLFPNGTIDTSFNSGTGYSVASIDVVVNTDDSVIVTGYSSTYSGSTVNGIVKLNKNGTVDSTFNNGGGFNIFSSGFPNGLLNTEDGNILSYGYFTSYSGSSANRIVKINQNGTVNTAFLSGSGFDASVSSAKTVLGDKIQLRGNFTTYCNISSSKSIILNQDGTIYRTSDTRDFMAGETTYNVGTDGYLQIDQLNSIFNVSPTQIITNAGTKYYGINIITSNSWSTDTIDYGFGTDWIDILTPTGTQSTECVIRVGEKASQSAPEVYETRVMGVRITSGDVNTIVNITQKGLLT